MILAVVAILAGVITPMVFRQMMEARERSTTAELLQLEEGLVAFFEDVGRFPTEGEGLAALVSDPSVTGWQGPYVSYEHEEPVAQVGTDAWNLDYAYDLNPVTSPADAASVLVVSGGMNRQLDTGSVGATWTVGGSADDLQALVVATRSNREMTSSTEAEQENLATVAQTYFEDHAAYPTSLSQLSDEYIDAGIGSDGLSDQWNRSYVLTADNSAVPPTLIISSVGPDGATGGGDDVSLSLDSIIPGRKVSYYELAISQSVVTAQTGTDLTGDWTVDRSSFSLASVLETDGWGKAYEEKMTTRTLLSAGPDGDYETGDDNIPPGITPDDEVVVAGYDIEFVSVSLNSRCDKISVLVQNTSDSSVYLSNATVSWVGATFYYKKFKMVEDQGEREPYFGSGDYVSFKDPFSLGAGATEQLKLTDTNRRSDGEGSSPNLGGIDFTIVFSDGSVVTFSTPSC